MRALPFALVLAAVPALAHTPPPPPTPPRRPAPPRVQPPSCPLTPGTVFTGRYLCAQGSTALTLRVTEVRGTSVRAEFDFDHAPSRAAGLYTLTGTCVGDHLSLSPEAWVRQPFGYIMVGMRGDLSDHAARFRGSITHPSCGGFDVARR